MYSRRACIIPSGGCVYERAWMSECRMLCVCVKCNCCVYYLL